MASCQATTLPLAASVSGNVLAVGWVVDTVSAGLGGLLIASAAWLDGLKTTTDAASAAQAAMRTMATRWR